MIRAALRLQLVVVRLIRDHPLEMLGLLFARWTGGTDHAQEYVRRHEAFRRRIETDLEREFPRGDP